MRHWLKGWYLTIRMYLTERELYRSLGEPFDEENFVEVSRPDDQEES